LKIISFYAILWGMNRMKYLRVFIVLLLVLPAARLTADQWDCFTVIVGKEACDSGNVLLAHNEDDRGRNIFVNMHKLPAASYAAGTVVKLKNNAVAPRQGRTFGFLWFQIPGLDFADSYINEKGVAIASNACRSREDQPQLTDGGIGFMLRRLMAERASTAREAVEIAGKLIDTYGYDSSGRSYAVADKKEGWLLQVVNGKHWVARRVPDDQVAVIANCYTIGAVNLKDKKDFLGSPDIVSYAVQRGWYQPDRDGKFNFAAVYSAPGNITNEKNALRQWRGINLLSKKKFKMEPQFPFAFEPKRDVKFHDLFRVLRDHYEDTEYDLSNDYKKGSPNSTKNRTICTQTTRYSFVAVLRDELPDAIAHLVWIAFGRPDTNAYSPWYVSIPSPPEGYTYGSSRTALQSHFQLPAKNNSFCFHAEYAYCRYARLSELVDKAYRSRIRATRKEWKNFESYTAKQLRKMEKEFKYLLETDQHIAKKIITNFIYKLEYRKWFLASELIRQHTKE
jgi:dipeptidase